MDEERNPYVVVLACDGVVDMGAAVVVYGVARAREVMEDHVLQLYAEDEEVEGGLEWWAGPECFSVSDPSGSFDAYAWALTSLAE